MLIRGLTDSIFQNYGGKAVLSIEKILQNIFPYQRAIFRIANDPRIYFWLFFFN